MALSVRRRALAAASVSLLAVSCGSSDGNSASNCSVPGENTQVLSVMQSWYYWYQSVPAGLKPEAYDGPQELVDAIRRQQPLDRFSFVVTKSANDSFYGAGQYVGYGLGFRFNGANELDVTRVFAGSPAGEAGITRG